VTEFDKWFDAYSQTFSKDQWSLRDAWNAAVEHSYMVARGHTNINGTPKDGFAVHGNRQLYWKGRCDAATEIRNCKVERN
jgi:hypothetical protein